MKFGGRNEKAEQRVNQLLAKMVNAKTMFVLVALVSLALVAGANAKFTG